MWVANTKLRRRKYDECIALCTNLLEKNPYDQVQYSFFIFIFYFFAFPLRSLLWKEKGKTTSEDAALLFLSPPPRFHHLRKLSILTQAVWYLKARALTLKNWIDDTEIEEEVGTFRTHARFQKKNHIQRLRHPTFHPSPPPPR